MCGHSGGERSLGETKYIIGDSYTVGKVWASTFSTNWRKNWALGAFWENVENAFFTRKKRKNEKKCILNHLLGPNNLKCTLKMEEYDDWWIFLPSDILDIIQTSPDTPRHHPDTLDRGVFAYAKALEENAIAESTDSSSILFHFMWHLYYPRHLPHTLRHNPDTPRHHPDTPDIGVLAYEKALEEKAIAESKDSSSTALNSYK